MIIDSLTHITPDGKWYNTDYDSSYEALTNTLSTGGVDRSVLCGMPLSDSNDYIVSITNQEPGKYLPVAGYHPVGKSVDKIEEELVSMSQQGFMGIKIHPRISQIKLDADEITLTIKKAGQLGLVTFICTIQRPPAPPLNRPVYDALHYVCNECKDSKIVLLHGGYFELLAVSEIVRPFENVFLDLSTTLQRFAHTSLKNDIKFLIKTFDKRIVFGSDFPEYSYADVINTLRLLGYGRDELEHKGILGDNFLKFIEQ